MRSDLEKRLDEIRESLRQGEQETAQREMDEFQESLEKTRPVTYCSNAIVNAVVHEKKKKLHDLDLTRMISIQMGPQIRLVQNNDTLMVDKIQSTLVNTIPLWKSQMVLALGVTHSQQAAAAQRGVTELTNQMLRKNAETLKMATIETARESERGIVDIETLRATNESLISTLDEVMQIQAEGRQKRAEAEVELRKLEDDLKHKLLSVRK